MAVLIRVKPLILAVLMLLLAVSAFGGEFTITGSAANTDAARLEKNSPRRNAGTNADLTVGDNFIPQTRTNNSIIRFNTYDDSMRAVGAATWDSARVGLVLDIMPDADDSVCVTAFKVTTAGWIEGGGLNTDTCGVSWDSANAIGYTDCAGDALDWTTDGGDYSATRETNANHPDSLWISTTVHSVDDTVYFYISSATVSDTMGNHAGILIRAIQYANTNADNDCILSFDSDDQTSRRPFLTVWYTTGGEPPAESTRRRREERRR